MRQGARRLKAYVARFPEPGGSDSRKRSRPVLRNPAARILESVVGPYPRVRRAPDKRQLPWSEPRRSSRAFSGGNRRSARLPDAVYSFVRARRLPLEHLHRPHDCARRTRGYGPRRKVDIPRSSSDAPIRPSPQGRDPRILVRRAEALSREDGSAVGGAAPSVRRLSRRSRCRGAPKAYLLRSSASARSQSSSW